MHLSSIFVNWCNFFSILLEFSLIVLNVQKLKNTFIVCNGTK